MSDPNITLTTTVADAFSAAGEKVANSMASLVWRHDPPTADEVRVAILRHRSAVWWWYCVHTSPEPQPIQFTVGPLGDVLFRDAATGEWKPITNVPRADSDRWAPCVPPSRPAELQGEDR